MKTNLARRAVALTVAGAMVAAGMVLLASSAAAAPQTERPNFSEQVSGPVSGVLANQVEFSIDQGTGIDDWWGLPNNAGPTTWTFDRPVDIRVGVDGLNGPGEDVQLPPGTVLEVLHANHTWDESTWTVSQVSGSCVGGCVSTFTLADTTVLTAEPLNALAYDRAIAFVEVTYNVPVATVAAPADGGTYVLGDGTVLDYSCEDGTGELADSATIDGQAIENGDPIDGLGVGTWTIDVTCVDSHGATHTSSVTFTVEEANEPDPDPTDDCKEDGLQAFQEPYFPSDPTANGVSKGVHEETEPFVEDSVDPLVTSLGLPALQPVVHDLNCGVVEPVEDILDPVLIPITTELGNLLRGLFG